MRNESWRKVYCVTLSLPITGFDLLLVVKKNDISDLLKCKQTKCMSCDTKLMMSAQLLN